MPQVSDTRAREENPFDLKYWKENWAVRLGPDDTSGGRLCGGCRRLDVTRT